MVRVAFDAAVIGLDVHGGAFAVGDALGRVHVFDQFRVLRTPPMADGKDPKLELFKLFLATAEKVSDRRAQANSWMLSVNSAIVALYGYLQADKLAVGTSQKAVWLWAIPAAGALVCVAWVALLTSYSKLNRAKFAVLTQIEADLAFPLFTREREAYRRDRRRSLSTVERLVPGCFVLLYGLMLVAAIVAWRAG
jgi:hypothetical protein